jgi:hypothetical protein
MKLQTASKGNVTPTSQRRSKTCSTKRSATQRRSKRESQATCGASQKSQACLQSTLRPLNPFLSLGGFPAGAVLGSQPLMWLFGTSAFLE